ncbi:hypothetical protein [Saccharopolyspora rosea]|uniref:Prenyltransferase n=1 Tax=Saccharopolyspora rosea TaxID=524884 RepID=A0ABW3FW24_9PSEU|nr:hypothetical protein [Saccharopolyspora rosea]
MNEPLQRAEWFVWLTARALEQHRFAHHFLGGSADAVEAALAGYAHADGGFGYALEPDLRGPVPEPLSAAFALRVLDEIGRCDEIRVKRLLSHFEDLSAPDGGLPARYPAQRTYPSASAVPPDPERAGALLSTGTIVGLLRRNGIRHPWLDRAEEFCWDAVERLDDTHPYEVESAVTFLDSAADRGRARAAARRLGELVRDRELVLLDPDRPEDYPVAPGYAPGEHHLPHDFAPAPGSLAASWFSEHELRRSLDFLADQQEPDGGWPIRWPEWAPGTRLEWRPIVTIDALLALRAHGRG